MTEVKGKEIDIRINHSIIRNIAIDSDNEIRCDISLCIGMDEFAATSMRTCYGGKNHTIDMSPQMIIHIEGLRNAVQKAVNWKLNTLNKILSEPERDDING